MYATPNAGLLHEDLTPAADSVSPALAFLGQTSQTTQPQDAIDPLLGAGADIANVRVNNRSLVFPDSVAYQNCIHTFFDDFHCYYPCVDEQRFRVRSQKMLAPPEVHPDDVCLLALNYIMFALHAVSSETTTLDRQINPPGWHWLQLADVVVGKRQFVGHGDISLAQFLLFKVRTSIALPYHVRTGQLHDGHIVVSRAFFRLRSFFPSPGALLSRTTCWSEP